MKTFILIFSLLILGCETLPEPKEKEAIYQTTNETYTVENTTEEEFINKVINDKEIIRARYKDTELEWTE